MDKFVPDIPGWVQMGLPTVLALIGGVLLILGFTGDIGRSIRIGGLVRPRLKKWGAILVVAAIIIFFAAMLISGNFQVRLAELQQPGVVLAPDHVVVVVTPTPKVASTAKPPATPTIAPTPTPLFGFDISQPSGELDVSQFVALYYETINRAQDLYDFEWPWGHLSYGLQSVADHDMEEYARGWLQYRVKYEIWECTETRVDVLLRYFGKGDVDFRHEYTRIWIRYELDVVSNNEWQLNQGLRENEEYTSICTLEEYN